MAMKNISYLLTMLFMVFMNSLVSSCSNDDDDSGKSSDSSMSVSKATNLIVGTWYCEYQQWTENGDTESATYVPSPAYSIQLSNDKSGYMISGSDQLFEIKTYGSKKYFTWNIQNKNNANYLVTDIYGGEEWQINKLTSTSLWMTWKDEGYRIYCKFVKSTGN